MERANISGERIKQIRSQRQLGQVEISAALDVEYNIKLSQSDISEIERGERGIKDYELDAFARILEADPTWLLRGDDG